MEHQKLQGAFITHCDVTDYSLMPATIYLIIAYCTQMKITAEGSER